MSVSVITDSNSGITQKQAKGLGIRVVPMPFYIDEKVYYEDITMSQSEFYDYLAKDVDVKTSQPTPESLIKIWREGLSESDEIVYIPMSSGLSSSCQNAQMLAGEDEFAGRVHVVDNQRISVTQRQSTLDAIELSKRGYSGEEIKHILLREKFQSSIYIMLDTLYYLKKGGRITPAAAAIGTVLRIKPVLQIQGEKLDAYAKAKTLKQAKRTMIKAVKNDLSGRFKNEGADQFHIEIAYTKDDAEAMIFREEIKEEFPDHDIWVDPLSLSISCHIGEGALALAVSRRVKETL